jgi:5'-methylthioadenosine phosphorylase
LPYRANIYAMKVLGVRYLVSFSAVGSLCEELRPLDMVVPDQFIDLTRRWASTFFGDGAVAHVSMAEPVCAAVASALVRAVAAAGLSDAVRVHAGGTYICIEGPQFSTRAESMWYLVTDYDCWHPREANVNADLALANLKKNAEHARRIAAAAIEILGAERPVSIAHSALASGLVTQPQDMAPEVRQRLAAILPP